MEGGRCKEIPPGSDMPVQCGELSALPSWLTGEAVVCKWDHVGPPLRSEARSHGKVAPARLTPGKGITVKCGIGPLWFCIHCGELDLTHESPSLGHTAHTVLCMASMYLHC